MRFDLTDLRLFLAVVDAGSITHGAAEIGLSLPAASERLRDMEATGEVVLLHRGRRGITPTEAGEMLTHHARTILHQMARMRGDIGHYAKGMRASVRIVANTATVTEFLPDRLGPWMADHPQLDIELKERGSAEIARSIAAGFGEIGILSSAVETGALTLRPFAVDRLVVVTSGASADGKPPGAVRRPSRISLHRPDGRGSSGSYRGPSRVGRSAAEDARSTSRVRRHLSNGGGRRRDRRRPRGRPPTLPAVDPDRDRPPARRMGYPPSVAVRPR